MSEVVSSYWDWLPDYEGLDTNHPQGSADPGSTGEATSAGAWLRELKKGIRQLSVDMAYDRPIPATFVDTKTFQVSGVDLRESVGKGQVVRCVLSGGFVEGYTSEITFTSGASQVKLLLRTGDLDSTLSQVRFSQFRPRWSEFQRYNDMPLFFTRRCKSAYPLRGGWFQVWYGGSLPSDTITTILPWEMPDTNYRAFLRVFNDLAGGPVGPGALCMTRSVTKTTTEVTFKLVEPLTLGLPLYEVFVWHD